MKNRMISLLFVSLLLMLFLAACSDLTELKPKTNVDSEQTINKERETNSVLTNGNVQVKQYRLPANKKVMNAKVIKNVDGDTVVINLNGKDEKVRMLCIDTPETHHPRLGVQPFGPEAAAFTKSVLYVGRIIQVEPGIGNGRDKYGRLLAYIYIDGKMFNKMLLEKGLARVAYIYPPNTQYVDEFYAIQKKAQQLGIGIWSLENYAQSDGFHSQSGGNNSINSTHNFQKNGSQNNSVNTRPSLNCEGKIKGNKNSHIYHLPGDTFYKSTKKNIVWFCAEQDAINAGYHKSKR